MTSSKIWSIWLGNIHEAKLKLTTESLSLDVSDLVQRAGQTMGFK